MTNLPKHGRVNCTACFQSFKNVEFDLTKRVEGDWRITANPLAWGNSEPEVIVLGFSKGPTQSGALASSPHNQIAYKGSRTNVGKILQHIGLIHPKAGESLGDAVNNLIANQAGKFHFASLIRCTVERNDAGVWKGSGGGMLDKFVATPFGKEVSSNCTTMFLKELPLKTKLIVMFGMGTGLNYVRNSYELYRQARGGDWRWINEVFYTDGKVVVVHVEHFASQGNLLPRWLGEGGHSRAQYGIMAQQAISQTILSGKS